VLTDTARQRAKKLENELQNVKNPGPLYGIPVVIKDNILTFGASTTASSKMLENFDAPYQATVVEKLEAAGAIVVAKSNLDAFAHGSSTENSDFGPTLNPHDKKRVPGGSSGGSAAAVALDIAPIAIGTDTGGSIRLPASYTGVVGYKPTYGLVSRYGVIAMASSTDVVGPLTSSVEDCAYVLDVIAGRDPRDSTTIKRPTKLNLNPTSLKGLKVGVISEQMTGDISTVVRKPILSVIEQLKNAGANVSNIDMPILKYALGCYYIIMPAEVSSNLSRYDGLRFGLHAKDAKSLDDEYQTSRHNGFNSEVTRRILMGTFVLSSGYYDAYYRKAQLVRTKIRQQFDQVFTDFDILLGPTAPDVAFKFGENTKDPLKMYLSDIMTVGANLAGLPAISLPITQKDQLPVGLQLMAGQNHDAELLGIAKSIEDLIGEKV
jgi:aspartyl-tRNA(Asn)/glutamyl-tRNA(Gln) amidotransferase subunit A